jgi:hypothetical protein
MECCHDIGISYGGFNLSILNISNILEQPDGIGKGYPVPDSPAR